MTRTLHLSADQPSDVRRAAALLRAGGTVAFPTETVYGLGANALSSSAVAKIFAAKQRPAWDPLIVHVESLRQASELVEWDGWPGGRGELDTGQQDAVSGEELRRRMQALAERFWPGPLTLLLPRRPSVPDAVTAGRPLVGIRVPAHPAARELLRAAALPLAAPSANTFGHTSPTTAQHVLDDLEGRIDAVLDGGAARIGVESTVVDPGRTPMVIYRPGAVTAAELERATGVAAEEFQVPAGVGAAPEALPAPGVGLRHYAPRARLLLVDGTEDALRVAVAEAVAQSPAPEGVFALVPKGWIVPGRTQNWARWEDPDALASMLFASLRALDGRGAAVILCPLPGPGGLRDAIRDRLRKAAREA